jgi:hypothetical protein
MTVLAALARSADRRLLSAGVVACALALLLMLFDARAALVGWLAGFALWSAVPIGALVLLLMVRLIPGTWREELEPPAQAMCLLLPLVLLAALPILLGAGALFPWAGVTREGFQDVYLTRGFFAVRTLLFLGVLGTIAVLVATRPAWSTPIASIGLIVIVLLDTLFAVDWIMSLEPDFHSSGFGLYVLSIQVTIALAILIIVRLSTGRAGAKLQILAGLLLTALLFWAYFAFMQYVIIWSGNLPKVVAWYQHRGTGLWSVAEIIMCALGLAPMLLLFLPAARRSSAWLCALSGAVLLGKAVEVAWLVMPPYATLAVTLPAALLAAGGLSVGSFAILAIGPVRLRNGAADARTT